VAKLATAAIIHPLQLELPGHFAVLPPISARFFLRRDRKSRSHARILVAYNASALINWILLWVIKADSFRDGFTLDSGAGCLSKQDRL